MEIVKIPSHSVITWLMVLLKMKNAVHDIWSRIYNNVYIIRGYLPLCPIIGNFSRFLSVSCPKVTKNIIYYEFFDINIKIKYRSQVNYITLQSTININNNPFSRKQTQILSGNTFPMEEIIGHQYLSSNDKIQISTQIQNSNF